MLSKQQIKKVNKMLQKQIVQKFGLVAVALLVVGSVTYFGVKQDRASFAAGTATLTMTPASGSYVVGSNISVAVQENSGTDPVNAVQASLSYDATKLQYVSVAEGSAFPTVAATSTSTPGVVRLARGTLPGMEVTGTNTVATITFKVLGNSGTTNLSFDSAFSYIVRSTDNTNVLGTTSGATYTLKLPAPTISTVTPASGPTAGGTVIAVAGTGFVSGATVSVGGTAATGVSVSSATSLTATVPARAAGLVNVVVTNPDGQSVTKANAYTYIAPNPTITGVSPSTGLTSGGTAITITGANFTAPSAVTVGGVAATSVTFVSSTQITAVTPARPAGAANIVVTFASGAVTLNNAFTYTVPAPTISTVAPTSGLVSGGTTITISGTDFVNVSGVTIGGAAATGLNVISPTSLSVVAPARPAGAVSVVVTTATGSATKTNAFTYVNPAPTLSSVSPVSGTATGGSTIVITGSNFMVGATVQFGTVSATNVAFLGATSLRVTAPAGTGTVSVVVTNPDGQKATLAAAYTYLQPGDANNDGRVNAIDLSIIISHDSENYSPGDFNADGTVGSADLAILLGRWTW